ncbi:MAG: FecR domain-containing protein [Bacteroidetes bacterium]|nr:FecR domain-containing protein [Bacteroidota bacterium]
MEHTITKHILFEYLNGRATPLEKQATEEWLKDANHTEQFHRWLLEWETQSPQLITDTDAAFRKLVARLEDQISLEEAALDTQPERRITLTRWLVAASVFVALCLGGWLVREPILYKTYETDYAQTSAFTLSDGSHVVLNANSTLLVPRFGFNAGTRQVQLQGEAEFSVRHTRDNRRFVVKTSDTFQVEVLGTEFTVFARSRGTKVALSQGKIRLDYTQGTDKRQLMMKPGELATLNEGGDLTVQLPESPDALTAWKEQRFVFNNTSVQEICTLMQENFGVVVRTGDPEIAARTISGNFKAQTAEDLLEVLVQVLNLEIRKENKTLLLLNPNLSPKS